jgi:hypothetical protein
MHACVLTMSVAAGRKGRAKGTRGEERGRRIKGGEELKAEREKRGEWTHSKYTMCAIRRIMAAASLSMGRQMDSREQMQLSACMQLLKRWRQWLSNNRSDDRAASNNRG